VCEDCIFASVSWHAGMIVSEMTYNVSNGMLLNSTVSKSRCSHQLKHHLKHTLLNSFNKLLLHLLHFQTCIIDTWRNQTLAHFFVSILCAVRNESPEYLAVTGSRLNQLLVHYNIHCEPKKDTPKCFRHIFYKTQSILIKFVHIVLSKFVIHYTVV